MMRAALQGVSYYLPEGVLTNEALHEEFPEWSVEKIGNKVGILERHVVADDETASDLAHEAALKLFDEHGVSPEEIDFLILCTQTPDYFLPTTACLLQDRLGLPTSAGAMDINLGCSGYVYCLSVARGLIATGDAQKVLILTADTYTKLLHPADKSVRTIFGDAATATLVGATEQADVGIGASVFGTDGSGGANLIVKTGGMRQPRTEASRQPRTDIYGNVRSDDSLYMNGKEIYVFTLDKLPGVLERLYAKSGLSQDDFDLFFFHQANRYILDKVRTKIGLPKDKFYIYLENCGNTVSSTIPIALRHALDNGTLTPGQRLMLVGFGVGYSWGAVSVDF